MKESSPLFTRREMLGIAGIVGLTALADNAVGAVPQTSQKRPRIACWISYWGATSDVDSLERHGRTLSYVYLEDGTFVNAELVKHGYAVIMTIRRNVKYAALFLKLQKEARENNRGLWKEE